MMPTMIIGDMLIRAIGKIRVRAMVGMRNLVYNLIDIDCWRWRDSLPRRAKTPGLNSRQRGQKNDGIARKSSLIQKS